MNENIQATGTNSVCSQSSPRTQAWLAFFSGVIFIVALFYLSLQAEQFRHILTKTYVTTTSTTALTLKIAQAFYAWMIPIGVLLFALASLPILHVCFSSAANKPAGLYRLFNYIFLLLLAGVLVLSGSLYMSVQDYRQNSANSKSDVLKTKDGVPLPTMPGINSAEPTTPNVLATKPQTQLNIKEEWLNRCASLEEKSKNTKTESNPSLPQKSNVLLLNKSKLDTLSKILNQLSKERQEKEFQTLIKTSFEISDEYDQFLRTAFMKLFLKEKDRTRLVALLANKFPINGSVEYDLAVSNMDNAITTLAESYSISQNEGCKKAIVNRLRASFPSLVKEKIDDKEFVKTCAQWYLDNKNNLVVNSEWNMISAPVDVRKDGLFLPKQSPK